MRYILIIMLSFFVSSLCFAQTKTTTKKTKTKKMEIVSATESKSYTGIILKKPWSKSTQSYCAQGSEYFVLKIQEEEWVIENKSKVDLEKYHEKEVTVTAFEQTRKIPAKPENPYEQRPVNPSFLVIDGKKVPVQDDGFTCTVLVIEKI